MSRTGGAMGGCSGPGDGGDRGRWVLGGNRRDLRRWLGVLGLCFLFSGVGCTTEEPASRDDSHQRSRCDIEGLSSCGFGVSCGGDSICFERCCHQPCSAAADCAGALGCDGFGCVCDEGACTPTSCSSTAECNADLHCVGGSCEEATANEAASCSVIRRWGTITSGSELLLLARVFDAVGELLIPPPEVVWESSDPARASVLGDRLLGGEEEGPVGITARAGPAICTAEVESHGPTPEDGVRVLAVDAVTGLPLEGALAQIDGRGVSLSDATDARGVAIFPRGALPNPPWNVSVFHQEYSYVSIWDVSSPDLRFPLSRHEEGPLAAGFRGTFDSNFFDPSRLSFGLAGASIPGNLLDLEMTMLVGPTERVEIDLGGARSADLSSGLVFGVGNTWFKGDYRATATPGPCDDRAASLEGRCGFRTAWGLAGGIPLEELPLDDITADGEVNAGSLLARLLPSVRRLRSAIIPSVPVVPLPRIDGKPDFASLPEVDLSASMRLSLRTDVRIPKLPSPSLDGVVALVGGGVPGRGMVPLGLTGALDEGVGRGEAPTGVVVDPVRGRPGLLDLRFAPLHSGLEGSDYLVIVLAVGLGGLSGGMDCEVDDRSGCTPVSGLIASAPSLPWGEEVDLSRDGFLGLADKATFDPATRRLELGGAIPGADLLRLQLEADGKKWQIYFPAGASSLVVPLPAGAEDRVPGAAASVQAMETDLSQDELVGHGPVNFSDFTTRATRFSAIDLPRSGP